MYDFDHHRRTKLRRWVDDWLPALEHGVSLEEIADDASFAYLTREIGSDRYRLLGEHFRGKRVLVLGPPAQLRYLSERFFVGGAVPEVESVHKAARWPPGGAIYGDAEVLAIEVSFRDDTKLFRRLKSHIHHFPGPVVTMGHFALESQHHPPKEASSALRLFHQKPPNVQVVWASPVEGIREGFERLGLAEKNCK